MFYLWCYWDFIISRKNCSFSIERLTFLMNVNVFQSFIPATKKKIILGWMRDSVKSKLKYCYKLTK